MCLWKSLKQICWFKDKVVLEWHWDCKRLKRAVLVLSLISSLQQTTKLLLQPLHSPLCRSPSPLAFCFLSLPAPSFLLPAAPRSLPRSLLSPTSIHTPLSPSLHPPTPPLSPATLFFIIAVRCCHPDQTYRRKFWIQVGIVRLKHSMSEITSPPNPKNE